MMRRCKRIADWLFRFDRYDRVRTSLRRLPLDRLILFVRTSTTWFGVLLSSHALVILSVTVALWKDSGLDKWSYREAWTHFQVSGEAAVLSLTLAATAVVSLWLKLRLMGRIQVLLWATMLVFLAATPLVWGEVLLGHAEPRRAQSVSLILLTVTTIFGAVSECMMETDRLVLTEDPSEGRTDPSSSGLVTKADVSDGATLVDVTDESVARGGVEDDSTEGDDRGPMDGHSAEEV
jgi:hypothetical protein